MAHKLKIAQFNTIQKVRKLRANMNHINNNKYMIAMIKAAVALPEPVKRGSVLIIFLAFNAFNIAIGSRIIPMKIKPMMANFKASLASLQG